MNNRPDWHSHWIKMAYTASEMVTCVAGRKVGAVFVKNNRVLVTGFNGVPVKYPHPEICIRKQQGIPSGEALHLCKCAHAEVNAIVTAARHGVSLVDSYLYCTTMPCTMCAGAVANVGTTKIFYAENYNQKDSGTVDICKFANIDLQQIII